MKYISIEAMFFGDYRVQVWDENLNSLLDKEYFCCGYTSAYLTALTLKDDLFQGLPIYLHIGVTKRLIKN